MTVLLVFTACAATTSTPEQIEYQRQDRLNQLLDYYYVTKARCRSNGLAVVIRQNSAGHCSGKVRLANDGACPPKLGDRVLGCSRR